MTLSRRRFLSIAAISCVLPNATRAETWRSRAFGADISIQLQGSRAQTSDAFLRCEAIIRDVERTFSLYDAGSELSMLNANGQTTDPSDHLLEVISTSDVLHHHTGGLFDPTIQTLWVALARAQKTKHQSAIGDWSSVDWSLQKVVLADQQALSFNGIAQGYATDLVSVSLKDLGFQDVLVNIGEYRATGGAWQIGLQDPSAGLLGKRTLHKGALATSSPGAMHIGGRSHILHRSRRPQWSSVTVQAKTAILADGLSTALTLARFEEIRSIRKHFAKEISEIFVTSFDGDLQRV